MASILDEFLILFKPTVKGNGLTKLNRDLKQTHSNLFSMKNLFSAFIGYDIYSLNNKKTIPFLLVYDN